jgi:hypothetical protein
LKNKGGFEPRGKRGVRRRKVKYKEKNKRGRLKVNIYYKRQKIKIVSISFG